MNSIPTAGEFQTTVEHALSTNPVRSVTYACLGRPGDAELAGCNAWLTKLTARTPHVQCLWAEPLLRDQSIKLVDRPCVDVAIVWQSVSDLLDSDEVDDLLAIIPLSYVLAITGPWCEGDGRTRSLFPPAVRCPWWMAQNRLRKLFYGLQYNAVEWLPRTASRDEVIQWVWQLEKLETIRRFTSIPAPLNATSVHPVLTMHNRNDGMTAIADWPTADQEELLRRAGYDHVVCMLDVAMPHNR